MDRSWSNWRGAGRTRGVAALLLAVPALGVLGGMAAAPKSTLVASSESCIACHRMDTAFSHPIGVSLGHRSSQDRLPAEDGRMTCLTCHQVEVDHAAGRTRDGAGLRAEPLELCASCHDPSAGTNELHAASLGRAHLRWSGERPARGSIAAGRIGRASGYDPESTTCLSCHDGSMTLRGSHDGFGRARWAGVEVGHPVGVPYLEGRTGPLHPPTRLDPRIRLFDGQVGCGSCHNPYAPTPKRLAMPNEASALCLECHRY